MAELVDAPTRNRGALGGSWDTDLPLFHIRRRWSGPPPPSFSALNKGALSPIAHQLLMVIRAYADALA
jgi:hypothetical protein